MSLWTDMLGAQVRMIEGRYRTRIIEAGQGEPLLLLHGTGGHAENWVKNIIPLSKKFHVIAPDFLWHGMSDTRFFDKQLIPPLVDQVVDILDVLGLRSAHIEGQSMGGWVAMRFALSHPDRVERLVLTTTMGYRPDPGTVPSFKDVSRAPLREFFLGVLRDPSLANVRSRYERIVADPSRIPDEAIEVRSALYRQPELNAVQQRFIYEYNGGEEVATHVVTDADAARIAAPTLVYWGEKNTSPAALGERLASVIPNARFFCAADTGHWAQFEHHDIHDKEVTAFLEAG